MMRTAWEYVWYVELLLLRGLQRRRGHNHLAKSRADYRFCELPRLLPTGQLSSFLSLNGNFIERVADETVAPGQWVVIFEIWKSHNALVLNNIFTSSLEVMVKIWQQLHIYLVNEWSKEIGRFKRGAVS